MCAVIQYAGVGVICTREMVRRVCARKARDSKRRRTGGAKVNNSYRLQPGGHECKCGDVFGVRLRWCVISTVILGNVGDKIVCNTALVFDKEKVI